MDYLHLIITDIVFETKAKIAEVKRHQENSQKIEVLVNKASQALDDVWD